MTHNELKKGDRVLCAPRSNPRVAHMADNRKGIIRYIECSTVNGYFPEVGTIYVDEILAVERQGGTWEDVTLSDPGVSWSRSGQRSRRGGEPMNVKIWERLTADGRVFSGPGEGPWSDGMD